MILTEVSVDETCVGVASKKIHQGQGAGEGTDETRSATNRPLFKLSDESSSQFLRLSHLVLYLFQFSHYEKLPKGRRKEMGKGKIKKKLFTSVFQPKDTWASLSLINPTLCRESGSPRDGPQG